MIPRKNARCRLCFIFGGGNGVGVESRPVDGGGVCKKSFYGHKMGPKCVILVGLGLLCIFV